MAWPFFKKTEVFQHKEVSFSQEERDPSAFSPIFSFTYDGEKTPGEIGIIKDYLPDYYALRARSWQSYLESEITQTVVGKLAKWVIGSGLRLQAEPEDSLIDEDLRGSDVIREIETRFKLYSNSLYPDYSSNENLHAVGKTAYINSIIGGDVLCVLREEKGRVTVQLIDGAHVTSYLAEVNENNRLDYGVERDKRGRHVAYHVQVESGETKRIKAYDKSGQFRTAFLIYGLKYRLDEVRGISLFSAVLESLKKLDRYKESVVGVAEEAAKLVYFFENSASSDGRNPLANNIMQSANLGNSPAKETNAPGGEEVATKVAATTEKQTFNLTQGQTIKTVPPHSVQLDFTNFYETNFNIICSALNIPPEVARSMYSSNYSASRAAIKDWEHVLKVIRKEFSDNFYQPYYVYWLTFQAINKVINLPKYIDALLTGDFMTIIAYQFARFVGANVPNIDPVKEVEAVRKALGNDNIPLMTHEDAVEFLGYGDFYVNTEKWKNEITKTELIPQSSNIKTEKEEPKTKEE